MKKNILILVGTRPKFIKVTRFKKVAEKYPELDIKIVHTGQHYDKNMADVFFEQFKLQPDFFLNISQAGPTQQMGEIMIRLEELIKNTFKPDILIVPGDVNSTFAGALVANKMNIPLAHLESGLRSNDREMPEEINRLLTDEITDHFFVTEQSGLDNLKAEKRAGKIHFVGNTMIDTMVAFEKEIQASNILDEMKVSPQKYVLMTIHRPSNVDTKDGLNKLVKLIQQLDESYKFFFPIHPRTIAKLKVFELYETLQAIKGLVLSEPMGYFSFQKLVAHAKFILTDSGGIQEESTYRKVPCLTLRENTERPITVTLGTNTLVPFELDEIKKYILQIENNTYKKGAIPPFWDGKSTERILEIILKL